MATPARNLAPTRKRRTAPNTDLIPMSNAFDDLMDVAMEATTKAVVVGLTDTGSILRKGKGRVARFSDRWAAVAALRMLGFVPTEPLRRDASRAWILRPE